MALTDYPANNFTTGAANTKGAYVQLVASTPYDSSRIHLNFQNANAANRFFLVDFAVGPVGFEVVVVSNLAVIVDADFLADASLSVSVDIPIGSRISVRGQSVTAAATLLCCIWVENRALASLSLPVTYGSDLAGSRGTQIDPGAVISTKGAYVQITAATSARIDLLAICASVQSQGLSISSSVFWEVDIAVGVAGAEVVVLPNIKFVCNNGNDVARPNVTQFPISIPAGSRIAARCMAQVTTAVQRVVCISLIGMQEPATTGGSGTAILAGHGLGLVGGV